MNTTQQLLEDFQTLAPHMQAEILEFVHSLKIRQEKEAQLTEQEPNGTRLVLLMEEMSKKNLFPDIKDPATWQREIRQDRPLPGRE
jgi:hypothetical protein